MRSRTFREGSVGLLFLVGFGLFGVLVLWLRGVYFGGRSYKIIVEFPNAGGMQIGAPVRYRGVRIGRVSNIEPRPNRVDVELEITESDLAIPQNVVIEANQSGLISENSIDFMPTSAVSTDVRDANPFAANCQEQKQILCNNERLQGQAGVSLDELIRVTVRFANLYSDPQFFANVNSVVQNTSAAAQGVTQLTRDISSLTTSLKGELRNISVVTNSVSRNADKVGATADNLNRTVGKFSGTADRINNAVTQTANRVGVVTDKFGRTADQVSVTVNRLNTNTDRVLNNTNQSLNKVGVAADRFQITANQTSGLVSNLNNLLTTNKASLVNTLNNLSQASEQLRITVANLSPAINRVTQGQLIQNLETLSANAAQASANIRNLSNSLNDPTNLVTLQQTLDSARVTFQNAQKITSDLDDLTGDPSFRNNLRNLVNGLSGLVSSTEQLQQQVEVAQFLAPMAEATKMQFPEIVNMDHAPVIHPSVPTRTSVAENKTKKFHNQR